MPRAGCWSAAAVISPSPRVRRAGRISTARWQNCSRRQPAHRSRIAGAAAVTTDYLPHLHEPAPGLLIDAGCQGRGVALQTALGRAIATSIATQNAEALPLPVTPLRSIPFHRFHQAYVSALIAWYRVLDRIGA